ncbi:unnamed protein product [Sphagnum compactum]
MQGFWEGVFKYLCYGVQHLLCIFGIVFLDSSTMCGNGQLKHVAIAMDLAFWPSSDSNIVFFIENLVASIVDDVGGFNPSQKKEGILRKVERHFKNTCRLNL